MNDKPTLTYCTVAGVEHDDVAVFWEYAPPEPDVNFAGGVEVCSVILEDQGCIMYDMTDAELKELETRLLDDMPGEDEGL